MNKLNTLNKTVSKIVQHYILKFPLEKGKYKLRMLCASKFLIGKLDMGPWIRISGRSGFEWSVFFRQSKEIKTRDIFVQLCNTNTIFFDIGANIGYYSLIASPLIKTGHIYAFEPTPLLAKRISQNTKLNNFNNITINQTAVSDTNGSINLYISNEDSEENSIVSFSTDWTSITVDAIKIDSYIQDIKIDHIDIIKIDCEGSEFSVLKGCSSLFSGPRPPIIIMELNTETLLATGTKIEDILNFVEVFGYNAYLIETLKELPHPVYNLLIANKHHMDSYRVIFANIKPFTTTYKHE